MLIMPTIRRRYRARELRRLARARKAAAKPAPSSRCISRQNNAPQPKPAQQAPNRQPKPQQSQVTPAVKQKAAADVKQQAPQPKSAPCEQPKTATSPPRQQPEAVPAKAHSRNYCATSTPVITARNTEQVLKPSASKKIQYFLVFVVVFRTYCIICTETPNQQMKKSENNDNRDFQRIVMEQNPPSTPYATCTQTSKEEADDLLDCWGFGCRFSLLCRLRLRRYCPAGIYNGSASGFAAALRARGRAHAPRAIARVIVRR